MTDSRKEFEEWCSTNSHFQDTTRDGDGYEGNSVKNIMWRAWKGGRQSVAKGKRTEMTEHKTLSAFEQVAVQTEVERLKHRLEVATKTIEILNMQVTTLEDALFPSASDN